MKYEQSINNDNKLTIALDRGEGITNKLYYQGMTFYYVGINANGDSVYKSLDELYHYTILTGLIDADWALFALVDEAFKVDENDDMIRYFDGITGKEVE
jgi:hypothetical protein